MATGPPSVVQSYGFFSARYTRNNKHFIRRSQFDLHFKYALNCLRSYGLKFPTSLTSSTEKTK